LNFIVSKKIPVSQSQSPLSANPFAALEISADLPPGPEESKLDNRESKIPKGRVVLRREKSQRGGKTVVVVSDFAPHFTADDLEVFARKARKSCGCGGTVAGREIELQGDDPARVRRFFEGEGFRVAGV
jgi:translation initiation factor 1